MIDESTWNMIAKIVFVPMEEFTSPRGKGAHLEVFFDHYVSVHPQRGVIFYRHGRNHLYLQGNTDRLITEDLGRKMYPGSIVLFVPVGFAKLDVRDF